MAFSIPSLALIASLLASSSYGRGLEPRQSFRFPSLVSTSSQFQFFNSSRSDGTGTIGYGGNVTLTQYGIQNGPARFDGDCRTESLQGQYGGVFTAATVDVATQKTLNGLGGGFTFNATNVEIGLGMSYNVDQTLNAHLSVAKDGSLVIQFNTTNSAPLTCAPAGQSGMTCTAAASKKT